MTIRNLFATIPDVLSDELLETLLESPHFRLERIVSAGHAAPAGHDLFSPEQLITRADPGRAAPPQHGRRP
jgi:hypothetical protein